MDFDLDYAKTLLRVDEDWDEDRIQLLKDSVGKYVETTTGILVTEIVRRDVSFYPDDFSEDGT